MIYIDQKVIFNIPCLTLSLNNDTIKSNLLGHIYLIHNHCLIYLKDILHISFILEDFSLLTFHHEILQLQDV